MQVERIHMLRALIFTLFLHSLSVFAFDSKDLKTGDVILQSVPCYVCALIEIEEGAPYSHAGIALIEANHSISVLESWNGVEKLSLKEHLSYRRKNTPSLVLRPIDEMKNEIEFSDAHTSELFDTKYRGLNYDPNFLWNNLDEKGETLYCSEFVAKFLNEFLPFTISPKPMHFQSYRQDWIRYFHGTPPDRQPGISPADFIKSPYLKVMGEI